METRVFRTNLHNPTCIAHITPLLEQDPEIQDWEADVEHEFRPLKVSGEAVDICHIRELIREAGFDVYEEIPPTALSSRPGAKVILPILLALGSLGLGYLAASYRARVTA